MLLELFGLLFFTYIASVLSSILAFLGVLRALSTGKLKSAITVEIPVEKPRWECTTCGAHHWRQVAPRSIPRERPTAE